jgi:hypothetical protein
MKITPRFELGNIGGTPGAVAALEAAGTDPRELLLRHSVGDWGELDAEDVQANEDALSNEGRLMSCYTLSTGAKVWIITEWDRSATTLLLPAEY